MSLSYESLVRNPNIRNPQCLPSTPLLDPWTLIKVLNLTKTMPTTIFQLLLTSYLTYFIGFHPILNFCSFKTICNQNKYFLCLCLSVILFLPMISPWILDGSSWNFQARPTGNQQTICHPYQPSKPYPTLPYHPTLPYYPTLPLLPYILYLYLYYITIFLNFTFYLPCLTQPYPRFTPTTTTNFDWLKITGWY